MDGVTESFLLAWTQDPVLFGGVLLLATFLPPILFLVWIRNTERYAPEPWGPLFKAFTWGALGGTFLALILEWTLGAPPHAVRELGISAIVFTSVVVAPIVEEFTKALGFRWVDDAHVEVEDGLIYGAAAGLGFAATENLVYGVASFIEGGIGDVVATVVIRTFSTTFLHGVATAIVGYAIWRRRAGELEEAGVVTAYLIAVALHAAFNLGASAQLAIAFLASAALAISGFVWLRKKIDALDEATGPKADSFPSEP